LSFQAVSMPQVTIYSPAGVTPRNTFVFLAFQPSSAVLKNAGPDVISVDTL
jgi:hypothetical protein